VRKFVNVCFTSKKKEVRASEVRKVVERDPAWSWHLVGNSNYLNGDVGITGVGKISIAGSHQRTELLLYYSRSDRAGS
jgi:hypothetical protein